MILKYQTLRIPLVDKGLYRCKKCCENGKKIGTQFFTIKGWPTNLTAGLMIHVENSHIVKNCPIKTGDIAEPKSTWKELFPPILTGLLNMFNLSSYWIILVLILEQIKITKSYFLLIFNIILNVSSIHYNTHNMKGISKQGEQVSNCVKVVS